MCDGITGCADASMLAWDIGAATHNENIIPSDVHGLRRRKDNIHGWAVTFGSVQRGLGGLWQCGPT